MSKFPEGEYTADVKVTTTEIFRGVLKVDDEGNQTITVYMDDSVEVVANQVEEAYLGQTPLNRRGNDEYVTGTYMVEWA